MNGWYLLQSKAALVSSPYLDTLSTLGNKIPKWTD